MTRVLALLVVALLLACLQPGASRGAAHSVQSQGARREGSAVRWLSPVGRKSRLGRNALNGDLHDVPPGAITDNPEEEKVRHYAEKSVQIPWRRVYEVPGHVYFSHRRHVALGRLECVRCHGNVGESAAPITVAALPISMDRCMGCHAQYDAASDCNACHR